MSSGTGTTEAPEGTGWLAATVAAVRPETATARTLSLSVPGWSGHLAGQHVDIRLTAADGYTATRAYSIASPAPGETVEVTIERFDGGEVSPYLVDDVVVGDQLEVRGPIGGWFVWRVTQPEPVQLVAGGSGVVPLACMLRAHAAAGSTVPIRLLYSLRSTPAMLYAEELQRLAAGARRLDLVYTRAAPLGWPVPPGRLDAERLGRLTFPSGWAPSCYVCGPTGFVEAVADLLVLQGHQPAKVRTERFGPTGGPG